MIDPKDSLSLSRQAKALGTSRGCLYYSARPMHDADLKLMQRIDKLHLDYPFAGSRMLQGLLLGEGRLHISTLMKRMGVEAIYRRPNTSKQAPGRKIYPYLLKKLAVTRPIQVWAMDITYLPIAKGFVYLAAVVDWYSQRVYCFGAFLLPLIHISALRRSKRLWPSMASRKYSTPIKEVNSHRRHLSKCSRMLISLSQWTVKGLGGTMSLSSNFG
jgi:putative transposase